MLQLIENEPCFTFNVREFKENSAIATVLSLNYGRISVLLRGNSARAAIQPFIPLKLSLVPSKTDLYFLQDYEYCGEAYSFKLPIFFCATYLNELLYHLYQSKDRNPLLFGTYVATLNALQEQKNIESSLRVFELTLLDSLGYGLSPCDQSGKPLQAQHLYRFGIGMGFIEVNTPVKSYSGKQEFLRKIANIQSEPQPDFQSGAQQGAAASSQGGAGFNPMSQDGQTSLGQTATTAITGAIDHTATTATNANTAITAMSPQAGGLGSISGGQEQALAQSPEATSSNDSNSVDKWSDEELESAMRFSKHKVKGRRMSSNPYNASMGYEHAQYSGLVTPEGRPIGLSELLGPALSGEILTKIVAHKFDQDILKQSKELTNALFNYLLGKREIKSRNLYRAYLQAQAEKRAAAQSANAESTTAQSPAPQSESSQSTNAQSVTASNNIEQGTGEQESRAGNISIGSETNSTSHTSLDGGSSNSSSSSSQESIQGTTEGGAKDIPWLAEQSLEASPTLAEAGAKATQALKEQQELKKAKKTRAKRKSKDSTADSAATIALNATATSDSTAAPNGTAVSDGATTGTGASPSGAGADKALAGQAKPSKRRKAPVKGEVLLEPSPALLESEAKATAALKAQQEEAAASKRKRKTTKSKKVKAEETEAKPVSETKDTSASVSATVEKTSSEVKPAPQGKFSIHPVIEDDGGPVF